MASVKRNRKEESSCDSLRMNFYNIDGHYHFEFGQCPYSRDYLYGKNSAQQILWSLDLMDNNSFWIQNDRCDFDDATEI